MVCRTEVSHVHLCSEYGWSTVATYKICMLQEASAAGDEYRSGQSELSMLQKSLYIPGITVSEERAAVSWCHSHLCDILCTYDTKTQSLLIHHTVTCGELEAEEKAEGMQLDRSLVKWL